MIKPICVYCKEELNEFGAILLSPPNRLSSFMTNISKVHLCIKCYEKICKFIGEGRFKKEVSNVLE